MGASEHLLILYLDESGQAYSSCDPWLELKERGKRSVSKRLESEREQ